MENEQYKTEEVVNIYGLKLPLEVYDFFRTAGFVLILCTFFYIFIAAPNQIEGDSMIPNLINSDLIITDKIDKILNQISDKLGLQYSRGDIVVFQKPGHKDFVKRIVGMPGERISIHNGHIFVNGSLLEEEYINNVYTVGGDFALNSGEEILIPDGRYFVLGDNRMDSLDSRYSEIGLINKDWIKGRVIARYWPITRFSLFSKPNYNI